MNFSRTADILIVGGGIIGLSLARELYKKGACDITVLERGAVAGRESSYAAAGMLAPQAEADCADDFFVFARKAAICTRHLRGNYFDETGVDIELDRTGTLYLAFGENDAEELEKRFAWQTKATLKVEKLTVREILEIEPNVSENVLFGLRFPRDWQVENRKLLVALQKFAKSNSIEIRTNSDVKNLLIEKDSPVGNSKIVGVETVDGKFFAETIVLATGAWTSLINNWTLAESDVVVRGFPIIRPIRGQMICFKAEKRLFSNVIYTPRGYVVPRADHRILAGATVEDVGFDKSLTESGIESLRRTAFEISESLTNYEIFDQWAGLRPRAADGLPILGALPYSHQNLLMATGHYRNGILLAPLTAKILAEKIVENADSKYLKLFGLSRFFRE